MLAMDIFAKRLISKKFLYDATFTLHFSFSLSVLSCDDAVIRFRHKKHLVRIKKRSCFGLKYLFWSPQSRLEMFQLFATIHSVTLTNVDIQCSLVINIQRFYTSKCWKAPTPLPPAPEKYLPTLLLFLGDSSFNTLSRFPPGVTILLCFSRFMTIFAAFPLLLITNCF